MKNMRGITLFEVMVAVAIVGIVLATAVPGFRATIQNSSMTTVTNQMVTFMHAARSEAVKRRQRVTMCRGLVDQPQCDAGGEGLLVFFNADDDVSFDAGNGDTLVRHSRWLRGGIQPNSVALPHYVHYNAAGFSRLIGDVPAAGDIAICDERGTDNARVLTLTVTGRPQVRDWPNVQNAPPCAT
ncbi:MAG: GspH/FimT family pseudopilin [Pseudomonadota bacterium]